MTFSQIKKAAIILSSYRLSFYEFWNTLEFFFISTNTCICRCGHVNVHVEIPVMEGRFEACYCLALWFSSMSLEEISRLFLNASSVTRWWSEKRKIWITNSFFIAKVWMTGRFEDCYHWALWFSLMSLKEISGLFLNASRVTHWWLEKKKISITHSCFHSQPLKQSSPNEGKANQSSRKNFLFSEDKVPEDQRYVTCMPYLVALSQRMELCLKQAYHLEKIKQVQ